MKEGSSVTPPYLQLVTVQWRAAWKDEVQVTAAAKHRLLPIIDVKEWVQVVNTWTVEATATNDEEHAAENSMMIKTAKLETPI